jgi:hypothetical protein
MERLYYKGFEKQIFNFSLIYSDSVTSDSFFMIPINVYLQLKM